MGQHAAVIRVPAAGRGRTVHLRGATGRLGQAGVQHAEDPQIPQGADRRQDGAQVGHGGTRGRADRPGRQHRQGEADDGAADEPLLPLAAPAGAGASARRRHPAGGYRADGEHQRQGAEKDREAGHALSPDGRAAGAAAGSADGRAARDRAEDAEVHDGAGRDVGQRDHDGALGLPGVHGGELFPADDRPRGAGPPARTTRRREVFTGCRTSRRRSR